MALRGTNQEFGRPYNRRIVLESIRLHGPIARGEIARRVGLTVQTVSTIVRELEDQDYILSLREEPKGRGLPPATLRINPDGGYAVGIHITPLGISAALINLSGDVIESIYREAPNAAPDHAFELIGAMVVELTRLRAGGRVLGVGMALPGPFDVESMSFVGPTTMTGWKDVALRERLAASTGLPAFFETDMAAAAMGERLYGLGAQFSEYYYLYFGVGLGGVMVHDGSALRGAWGNAGEIGHIPVIPGGEACPCGNSGCLERYLSLEARRRWNGSEADWVAEVAPIFHNAVAVIENLFDPETVILGGLASTDLLEMLAGSAGGLHNSVSARKDRTTPRVVVARGGQHSVLRGAAALAVSGVLSPRFGQMFAAERERERDLLKGREIAA
ncbi:ROK family transcriptional regulator [Mesorhizobium sp. M7A.F.Ca.CA.001.07.2.1]|uniref:ROK family transcriptional regulator n=3 Tax=Phyllobacteriaceae TaxID=69277 RepID=UPI000FCBC4F6|nr:MULTISPECIES: ROK family transcriptional regulator [Mesorhizobium]MCF6126018.1 ROK family transcriptional regulator [Mesorhizobium ciceri]MCQ8813947.1 ROK family transcriptional regulator [Mesorhizobium sp. SEMIA396]RUX81444.1 ROK family transcriptional regulator [Mesorhizobium sp. M7A.F.Ca.CA.004.08.2.1]RUX87446.1 ROK family transcriptional regulator [Mesorhizobium sp. M7A.F.Ca.CA.004.08.1.1]RUY57026.1 ROK family transcriptional regulator [Mesorhizobium sp. M7A.F.Ca.CA.001.12.1.1]